MLINRQYIQRTAGRFRNAKRHNGGLLTRIRLTGLETLKSLKAKADPTIRFRGMTLKGYAKRYRKEALLEHISD